MAGPETPEVIDPPKAADDLLSQIERGEVEIIGLVHPDESALPSSLGFGSNARFGGLTREKPTETVLIGEDSNGQTHSPAPEVDLEPQSTADEDGVVFGSWVTSALNSRKRLHITPHRNSRRWR